MLTIFRFKFLLFSFLFFFIFIAECFAASKLSNCNDFNFNRKENPVKEIEIKFNNYRKWQVNNIRIVTDTSHVIKEKYKKRFKAKIFVSYQDNSICKYKARVRTHGDLKDHIVYKNGKIYQSLDVELKDGHINNIVKFKLFLPGTRGIEEDEIFMTEILRYLNFISPRTNLVNVSVNDNQIQMLFQEKIVKELLEYNNRREGAMFEGEEKFIMNFASKVKNLYGIDWNKIFEVSEKAQMIQLARQTNSNWSVKNVINQDISFKVLSYLNLIYLNYINHYKNGGKNLSFLDYHLDNNLLSLNDKDNLLKLDMYDALILSANGNHGLFVHNRKFYWNSLENFFEPIYYDGEFNLKKKPTKLNFPLSLNFINGVIKLEKELNQIKYENFTEVLNNKGIYFSKKKVKEKINLLIENLNLIKKIYLSKNIKQIEYDNILGQNEILLNEFKLDLVQNEINMNLLYLVDQNEDRTVFDVCRNHDFKKCSYEVFSKKNVRNILESEYTKNGIDYKYIGSLNKPKENFNNIVLNNDFFKNVIFYFNNAIEYNYDSQNNLFQINQINENGRAFFSYGEIQGVKIKFVGSKKNYENNFSNKIGEKALTGCVTFYKTKFKKTVFESSNTNCEDGINFISSNGSINSIKANDSLYDGIDIDFSSLNIEKIEIENSLNDCLDLSYGSYTMKQLKLKNCGDKGISVGEKSKANISELQVKNSNIGIASKDSSIVNIDYLEIINTKICVTAYKKKQEFSGAKLDIKKLNCKDFVFETEVDENSYINLS